MNRPREAEDLELLPASAVPPFASEADAAEWYGSHDTSELPGEEVTEDFGYGGESAKLETICVRITRREMDELEQRAKNLSTDSVSYVRLLINRHVLDEKPL